MTRKSRMSIRSSASEIAARLIESLAGALLHNGVSAAELRRIFHQAADELDASSARSVQGAVLEKDSAMLGSALALWHRDSRYLTADGAPRPLQALGRYPSIQSLVRAAGMRTNSTSHVQLMIDGGLVLDGPKKGTYSPAGRSAKMPEMNEFLTEHLAQGIFKLVQTVTHNYSHRGRSSPVFQQAASVRRLPIRYQTAFKRFTLSQGAAFISNVDDWLEARSNSKGRKAKARQRTMPAGVYAFAYCT